MFKKIRDLLSRSDKQKNLETLFWAITPKKIEKDPVDIDVYFQEIIQRQDAGGVEEALPLLANSEKNDEFIGILHKLILAHWHSRHEDIIHDLQRRKNSASIPYIKQAIQTKYEYLESYGGTRQFINQCGHALASIGNEEAIELIKELVKSNDPILKDEMLYRISKIENRNDYKRNYDLD